MPKRFRTATAAFMILALALTLPGCQSKPKRYDLRGQVVAKNPEASQITVDHEEIPGFTAAMTMPYKVKDPVSLNELEPGDKVAAQVVVSGDGTEYWLEQLRVIDRSGRSAAPAAARSRALKIGDQVPDVPLTNQDGKKIGLKHFLGKAVLVTFIYTRCPLPEYCPRLSSQFSTVRENLAKTPVAYGKVHLLSISIDPQHDTSAVLRKYGLAYLDNDSTGFSHWDFAFASPSNLRRLAEAFGLQYFDDKGQIVHSMNIILIAPDGTVANYWGQQATTAQLEAALREHAAGAKGQ